MEILRQVQFFDSIINFSFIKSTEEVKPGVEISDVKNLDEKKFYARLIQNKSTNDRRGLECQKLYAQARTCAIGLHNTTALEECKSPCLAYQK